MDARGARFNVAVIVDTPYAIDGIVLIDGVAADWGSSTLTFPVYEATVFDGDPDQVDTWTVTTGAGGTFTADIPTLSQGRYTQAIVLNGQQIAAGTLQVSRPGTPAAGLELDALGFAVVSDGGERVQFNITSGGAGPRGDPGVHVGPTAPTDTSLLWVRTP